VLTPEALAHQLPQMMEAIRRGSLGPPVAWGRDARPQLVLMSTRQYRTLRGDDEPPPGVPDDPTRRVYDTQPLPGSRPFDLDEWAKEDPFTQGILAEIREEEDRRADG
jgi:hypothetical protein